MALRFMAAFPFIDSFSREGPKQGPFRSVTQAGCRAKALPFNELSLAAPRGVFRLPVAGAGSVRATGQIDRFQDIDPKAARSR